MQTLNPCKKYFFAIYLFIYRIFDNSDGNSSAKNTGKIKLQTIGKRVEELGSDQSQNRLEFRQLNYRCRQRERDTGELCCLDSIKRDSVTRFYKHFFKHFSLSL